MHLLLRTALVCALLSLNGCIVIAAGVVAAGAAYGVIQYDNNEAIRDYRSGVADTFAAVRAELQDMGYAVTSGIEAGSKGGSIEVRDAKAEVERLDDEFTRVRVRFGTFETAEHRAQSTRLLRGVARRLGETP